MNYEDIRVELKGESNRDNRLLDWTNIIPYIPELKDKFIVSFKLDVVAGDLPKAIIEYRGLGEIDKESLTLYLSNLDLDLSGKVIQGDFISEKPLRVQISEENKE